MDFNLLSVNRSGSCQFDIQYYNFTQDYVSLTTFLLLDHGLLTQLLVILLIPFYLVTLRPILLYCIPSMLTRIGLGILFMMISLILAFAVHAVFQLKPHNDKACEIEIRYHFQNTTSSATILYTESTLKVLKHMFSSLFTMTYYVAINEFIICSQSPQSMKAF